MLEFRRAWTIPVDGRESTIEVEYAAVVGWMSIHVDGSRVARGWRERQTVVGGANLTCEYQGHKLHARVTQPLGDRNTHSRYASTAFSNQEVIPSLNLARLPDKP